MKVTVLRAFLHKGEVQPVGSVLDLPDAVAIELRHIGKVQPLPVAPAVPTAPAKKPPKPAATGGPMTAAGSALVAGATDKDTAP